MGNEPMTDVDALKAFGQNMLATADEIQRLRKRIGDLLHTNNLDLERRRKSEDDLKRHVAEVEQLRVLLHHAWNFRNPNIAPLDTYEAHVKLRCDICKEIYEALGEE